MPHVTCGIFISWRAIKRLDKNFKKEYTLPSMLKTVLQKGFSMNVLHKLNIGLLSTICVYTAFLSANAEQNNHKTIITVSANYPILRDGTTNIESIEQLKIHLAALVKRMRNNLLQVTFNDLLIMNKLCSQCADHIFPDDADKQLYNDILFINEQFKLIIIGNEISLEEIEAHTQTTPTIGTQTGAVVDYGVTKVKEVIHTATAPYSVDSDTAQAAVIAKKRTLYRQKPANNQSRLFSLGAAHAAAVGTCNYLRSASNFIANIKGSDIVGATGIMLAGNTLNLVTHKELNRTLPSDTSFAKDLTNSGIASCYFNGPVLTAAAALFGIKGLNRAARYVLGVEDVKVVTCECDEEII